MESIATPVAPEPFAPVNVVDAGSITIDQFRALPCAFKKDNQALVAAAQTVAIPGMVLEFGVFRGKTIRLLADVFAERRVYGFDSFEGLPEAWERSATSTYGAGHFAVEALPDVPDHVELVKGFFSDTLPGWLATHDGPVAFLHVDGDLYSSAKDVLWPLNDRIGPGCVIMFDELCDWRDAGIYPLWPEGEWKALVEWMATFDRKVSLLNRGPQYNAAVVVVQ